MSNNLDPGIQKKLEAQCRKISVAHGLDPGIQEELYGHMEDKFRAYISGEEPLTSADALLLVEKHFGNPAMLKGLLEKVHAPENAQSVVRRLAALWICMSLLYVVQRVLLIPVALLSPVVKHIFPEQVYQQMSGIAIFVILYALLWRLLARWKSPIEASQNPWFYRWNSSKVAISVVLSTFLLRFIPYSFVPSGGNWQSPVYASLVFALAQCVLWIWWTDVSPRSKRLVASAVGTWLLFKLTWTLAPPPLMLSFYTFLPETAVQTILLGDNFIHWQLCYSRFMYFTHPNGMLSLLPYVARSFCSDNLPVICEALVVYYGSKHVNWILTHRLRQPQS